MVVHVPKAITEGLRLRGVDVLTAQEDDSATLPDPQLLDRATALERVLFTRDRDLLAEASRRQRENIAFTGVIFAHQLRVTIGGCVNDLELIAQVDEPKDLANQVEYLPL
jgi:uncharacterized protein with PIN domain